MARRFIGSAAILLAVGLVVLAGLFARDTRRSYDRVTGHAAILASPWGPLEYSDGGHGLPVLVIHGAGGGYDQGELLAEAVLGDDFHWIAPSRFGYLGSGMPDTATWDDQADAFAWLLDQMGIESAAVIALSQGGPAALLLALRHPERVSSLTCVSCGVAPAVSEGQAEANQRGDMLRRVFSRDIYYWPLSRFFRSQLMGMLGANRDVVAGLTREQRSIVERIIEYMNPAAPRSAGVVMDNEATLPGARIEGIRTPTLIVHARDDLLQLFHNAEFATATIPGARLLAFDAGGHVVLAVEQDVIRRAVQSHVREHTGTAAVQRLE
jgi:2-hydroxy-6-oxonona-2,4-dienedioate hydrolase